MSDDKIESILEETRRFPPNADYAKGSYVKSIDEYKAIYEESIADPPAFWANLATNLEWFSPWDTVFEWDRDEARFSWFKGGKLNACYNCLDRHVNSPRRNKAAIIWQGEREDAMKVYTYQQLLSEVERFANVLKSKGVGKGDRVSIYLPMIPELAISLLACARIGAIHSVVFAGFSSEALYNRIEDCDSKILITSDGTYRAGKTIDLKGKADEALEKSKSVTSVIMVNNTGSEVSMTAGRDFWWHEEVENADLTCPCEEMDAEDTLFILYTSGSTGKPKGVVHTTGGYLLFTMETFKNVFDYKEEDVFWCTADLGWITGHSYILYGPLAAGATSVMFEGVPTYPKPDRYWHIVEKFRVNTFYTAPTAIRSMMRLGDEWPNGRDLSSLKVLGSVGEPINPEAWMWYYNVIGHGNCAILDTWWQTETGGHMITPLPGATTLKPGSATFPYFGIEPKIIKNENEECAANEGGFLCIDKPWPGLGRTLWGDHERYKTTYWNNIKGKYFSGDGARRDEEGYIWLLGRVDDVISVAGHRIGAAEVESALVSHTDVTEAAVVPVPHDIKGEAIYAFVTLREGLEGDDDLRKALVKHVRHEVGPIATPGAIQFTDMMPKTRSGKIMRRILRKIASGDTPESLGDTSTLADPEVIDLLIANRVKQ